ncbi:MAG: MFS transporter [Eubacteriales bacterium]|nr:MFS transporter [Eubacteriales bacterium]
MKSQSFYKQLGKDERYILTCCFFVFAVNGLYSMILGSMLPLISSEYQLSNVISGSLISAHQIGNLLASFIAGVLPIYIGRKNSVIFLCVFVIAGFLLMISTGNPLLLLLAFLFTGISRGSISNFNNSIVNEVSNSSAAAINFLHSVFAVGALLAPFLVIAGVNLMGSKGWKLAGIVIAVLAAVAMFLFSRAKLVDAKVQKKSKKMSYKFLKFIPFWINSGILFFYLCAEATINGWIVKYFVDSSIMTTEYAQVLASLLWAVILIGRLVVSAVGNKIPKKKILLVTSIGTTLFYMLLLSSRNTTVITLAIAGLGFSMAGIYPTTIANVGNTLKEYPMSLGMLLIIGGMGSILMPTITGALSDLFGIFAGMSAIVVAIFLMLVFVIINAFRGKSKA